MKFGVCIPHYGRPIDVGGLTDMAVQAEEMGFDSVWVTDHIIVPHEIPGRTDIVYRHDMLEPLSLLTHLGAVTSRVNIGTSVVILPYRNPIILGKAIATADVLSKGPGHLWGGYRLDGRGIQGSQCALCRPGRCKRRVPTTAPGAMDQPHAYLPRGAFSACGRYLFAHADSEAPSTHLGRWKKP